MSWNPHTLHHLFVLIFNSSDAAMPGPAGGARPPHGASRVVPAIPHALAPKLRQSQHPSNLHPPPSTASTGHFAGKEDVPVTLTEQAPNGSVTPTPEAAATQDHAGVQSDDGAASLAVEAHTFSHPSAGASIKRPSHWRSNSPSPSVLTQASIRRSTNHPWSFQSSCQCPQAADIRHYSQPFVNTIIL